MMLTRRAFLLHYKALKIYAELRSLIVVGVVTDLKPLSQYEADYIWHFLQPYVCVIHKDGRGYYLNREYGHIVSVRDIPNPTVLEAGIPKPLQRVLPHETIYNQAASFTTPDWARDLPVDQFTSYWMY